MDDELLDRDEEGRVVREDGDIEENIVEGREEARQGKRKV